MASLIVGHGRIVGIAPKAKIMPIRARRATTIPSGIDWAIEHGAQIINISQETPDQPAIRSAVERALAAGAVVVASAGNAPSDTDIISPANFPGVIAAAAIGRNGQRAEISVKSTALVLAAPGDDLSMASPHGAYVTGSGTSGAAALISGVAALVKAKYPNLSGREIYHRLTATADDKGAPGRDSEYGFGIVNPVKALTTDVPPLPEETTDAPAASPTNAAPPADGDAGLPTITLLALGVGVLLLVGLVILAVVLASRRRPT
jgi:subtilisin family serine protease